MTRKQYVIHLNNGEMGTKVSSGVLKKGEIAVNYNSDSPMLMIEKSDSTIATFIDEVAVDNKIVNKIDNLTGSATSTSNHVSVTAGTKGGNITGVTVSTTLGTFSSGTTTQKEGIATVKAAQEYIDTKISEVKSAAIGIENGTNITVADGTGTNKKISAIGTSASATNKDTDLALAKELWTLSGAVTGISADTKFTGAITGIATGNSYVNVEANGTNAKKISAQVSMLTATTLTATGKLADAKDVKDYVDKQVGASKITGATGDTNYIKAELKDNKITVSAIAGSTSADNPTGLATAADAKVTMSTANTTNGSLRTYTFKQGTREIGKVEIDKEKFVQYGRVFTATATTEPAETGKEALGYSGLINGNTYIGLQIGASTTDISAALAIPANSLVDTYSSNDNYITVSSYKIGAKTGDGGLATYAHVTTLSGNVDTKFKSYSSATEVQTALDTKANTADYKVKSGAAGTNTTAAITTNGSLSFNATGTAVASVTEANKSTALALADELKTLSGKVENIKIPTVPVSSVTGENYITATTTDGKVTVKATTAAISSTATTGLVLNTDVKALSGAVQTAIDGKAGAGHTHTLKLTNLLGVTESVTLSNSEATIDFSKMVIDCGTY